MGMVTEAGGQRHRCYLRRRHLQATKVRKTNRPRRLYLVDVGSGTSSSVKSEHNGSMRSGVKRGDRCTQAIPSCGEAEAAIAKPRELPAVGLTYCPL